MNQKDLPLVTVIIPMLNEEGYIEKCVQSVIDQDYPEELVEILVVDGGSIDSSVDIVKNLTLKHSNIKILGGPGINCPEGMNIGISNAAGEIICKVDAHGYIDTDFIKQGVQYLSENDMVKCVGGPIIPIAETFISRANTLARSSVFGVGRGVNTDRTEPGFVDTVQCGIYKKEIFSEIGFFEPSFQFGEDEEINWRIIKAGYKIFSTSTIRFFYYPRESFKRLYRQYYNYGIARVKVIRKHHDFLHIKHLIPSAYLLSLIGSGILSFIHLIFFYFFSLIIGIYLIGSLIFSLFISKRNGWRYLPALPISFACLHFGYGWGLLQGLRISLREMTNKYWTK